MLNGEINTRISSQISARATLVYVDKSGWSKRQFNFPREFLTMGRLRHSLSHPFRRFKGAVNVQSEEDQVKNQDNTGGTLLPTSPSQSTIRTVQSAETSRPLDLWKTAYGQLDEEDRRILSEVQVTASPIYQEDQPRDLIEEVIHLTTEQYEQYQQEATGKLRTSSRKIINAALSFKDIIGAVATFDPTQHAASAWAIVSLGLTVYALFDSSEYLADVLAQCAFIEKKFYLDSSSKTKEDLGNALIKLYRAMLHYTALVQMTQNASMGKKVLNSFTIITEHPLTELKNSVEKERGDLHKLVGLVSHLHHEEKAESILYKIDELADSMKLLIEQFSLVNLHVAEGAFYDSYVNEHEDFCLPGTRTELRSQISEWAKSSDGKCIFWLKGMAGTGKSTISRTVAQSFKEQGLLGATFFFKRGEAERGNAKYLISTIIKQLVTSHRGLVPHILNVIKNDLNISSKFLSEQFDKLLYQPLLKLHLNQLSTIVIVIDALDECDREDDIGVVLRLLFKLRDIKSVHVRIFLSSRPELPIRLGFKQDNNHQDLVLHELPKPVIEHDIRLFLEHKLSEIQNGRSLPPAWPGKKATEELVQISVPLFIFAATACRFIEKGTHPKKRPQKVLEFQATTAANQMDKIYLPVLNQLTGESKDDSQELLEEFRHIVGVIILLATPLSIESLGRLLQIPGEDISELLDHLNSVLYIPSHTKDPVRILHLSFRDYLLITESPFRINKQETHEKLVSRCLHVMENKLMHNICGMASYGTQRLDVDNEIIKRHLSAELEYSCQYWVYHLQQSKGRISETKILSFLKQHFLHWLEALSLLGIISEARSVNAELSDFLYDAKRFTLKNIYITGIAPLQLYCSGLAFSPMQSTIRKMFSDSIPKQLNILPQVEDLWSAGLQTHEGHSSSVLSVAFSPDGQTIASGSSDTTIKLWDAKTGMELQTFKGHSSSVLSVAFSPDGQTIASGSSDKTIKLWDAKTDTELQTFKGHSDGVRSVAFSPDGQTIASGSYDRTIKLWDPKTGTELQTFKGHSDGVRSVAFSPDGQTIASGSYDKTIKLWDARTGTELQTLKGHSVSSVMNEPNFNSHSPISLSNAWVALGGENLLWLPVEYRDFACHAVKDAKLALGHRNGRVSIVGFHTVP
ncbi:unnamed protein product [Aspergillus oryzae]|nr:unnamed protein product [Aspergillus oryzae]